MRLSTNDGSATLDYYPVRMPLGDISHKYLLKIINFGRNGQRKEFVTKDDFNTEVTQATENFGYNVIDFNVEPQLGNPLVSGTPYAFA